ncbi:MAG: rhodanese-like domain-containing protein [Myxococcota bacterium]
MLLQLMLLVILACSSGAPPTATTSSTMTTAPSETDIAGLKAAMDNGSPILIDVRTPREYDAGHVPGATLIPLNELAGRLDELAAHREQDIYLICEVGGRSGRATSMLRKQGFSRAINVSGGTRAWREAGHPVD